MQLFIVPDEGYRGEKIDAMGNYAIKIVVIKSLRKLDIFNFHQFHRKI